MRDRNQDLGIIKLREYETSSGALESPASLTTLELTSAFSLEELWKLYGAGAVFSNGRIRDGSIKSQTIQDRATTREEKISTKKMPNSNPNRIHSGSAGEIGFRGD
ncbi:hypothetical protein RF11_05747 [Thelohanellus kitauei]|uniref:Uncharacterized protein n=1 Tax=Thelohanellus kitauei TaxID=669202 RepID=A0A0C2NJR6_THEKT|nr:hypothetical protein RF11_05747 [Thelohanellus kitauei]